MSCITRKIQAWKESAWSLGVCENGFDDLRKDKIRWISNGAYKGKWFADPFVLDYDDQVIHLLVEEFDYRVHRGRIAKLSVDRRASVVTNCSIILDLETHLSFPMIFRQGDVVFVCPENYQSGGLDLYQYEDSSGKLQFIHRLIDEKLTDAILIERQGRYYILSTSIPKPNGRLLTVYQSGDLNGPFSKVQEIEFKDNVARNAGLPFLYDGKLIRPAQESNINYGNALVFQEMEEDQGHFGFTECCRFYSTHKDYRFGTHTFNQHPDGLAVLDVKGFRYPCMGRLLLGISRALVALHLKKQFYFE